MSMPGNNKTVTAPQTSSMFIFFHKDIYKIHKRGFYKDVWLDMTKGKEKHELERSLVWMQPKEERLERECCKLPTVAGCPYV